MAVNRKSLVWVVIRISIFWWCLFTLVAFGSSPVKIVEYLGLHAYDILRYLYQVVFACAVMVLAIGVGVYAQRMFRLKSLLKHELMGVVSTIGKVPLPNPPLPRLKDRSTRIPITGERLNAWLQAQYVQDKSQKGQDAKKVLNSYGRLFMAIWDTYCAHAHYPASHRLGGHGDKRLYAHCHDVAERALELAHEGWQYTGIYVKKKGRKPVLIMQPNSASAKLNPEDPIIALAGLAHDIGKLVVYKVDRSGAIIDNKEEGGNTLNDDDGRVLHDMLGPRVLALMPEYWDLLPRDRAALSMALAHYHHPSAFPLDRYKRLLDERAAAVMSLLIEADRAVSMEEAALPKSVQDAEMEAEQTEAIYNAFVKIVTEFGRINGVGVPADNAKIQIGQKHGNFIAIKELSLRTLMLNELGWSLDDGESRYHVTVKLLNILKDKDLLYVKHNGVDFSAYLPMYRVSIYHHQKSRHLTDLAPAIVIKTPPMTVDELRSLAFMDDHPAVAVIKYPMLTHLNSIKNREKLDEMIIQAFNARDLEEMGDAMGPGEEEDAEQDVEMAPGADLPVEQSTETVPPEPADDDEDVPHPVEYVPPQPDMFGYPEDVQDGPQAAIQEDAPEPVTLSPSGRKPKRLTDLNAADAELVNKAVQEAQQRRKKRVAQKRAQEAEDAAQEAEAAKTQSAKRKAHRAQAGQRQVSLELLEAESEQINQNITEDQKRALFGDID